MSLKEKMELPSEDGGKGKLSPAVLTATLGGLGFFFPMPGTLGSLAACVLFVFVPFPWWGGLALILLGTWASGQAERDLGRKDPGCIVIDEAAGMWLSMWGLPLSFAPGAFFLFRLLDIMKPWPVSWAEKLPGGRGIMADDLVCGVLVNLFFQLVNGWCWQSGWLWPILMKFGHGGG